MARGLDGVVLHSFLFQGASSLGGFSLKLFPSCFNMKLGINLSIFIPVRVFGVFIRSTPVKFPVFCSGSCLGQRALFIIIY